MGDTILERYAKPDRRKKGDKALPVTVRKRKTGERDHNATERMRIRNYLAEEQSDNRDTVMDVNEAVDWASPPMMRGLTKAARAIKKQRLSKRKD